MAEWWEDAKPAASEKPWWAPTTADPREEKKWWEGAKPAPGSDFDLGRFLMTATTRGLTALPDALADPLGGIRRLISPELAKIEESSFRPGRWVGDKVFSTTGIPEYQPTTEAGKVGLSTATGVVGGAPFGPVGALVGGLSSGLGELAQQVTGSERVGEAASMLPGPLGAAVGARFRSRTSPEVDAAGINPTPGQGLGGAFNRFEQSLSSWPIIGDVIRRGRGGAVEQFNRGDVNNALAPIDASLNPKTLLGRDAIAEAQNKIGERYDAVTPRLAVAPDGDFVTGLQRIVDGNDLLLPLSAQQQKQLRDVIKTQIYDRLEANRGTLTGEQFRAAETNLGEASRSFRHSPDPDQQNLGRALQNVQEQLRDLSVRVNPEAAAELRAIHTAYSRLAPIEIAAQRAGTGLRGEAEPGVYTPTQKLSAIREEDRSPRNRQFAAGKMPGQSYAQTAKTLLDDTVPDSGTASRMGWAVAPTTAIGLGLGAGALSLLYSPAGRATLNAIFRRPEQAVGGGVAGDQSRYPGERSRTQDPLETLLQHLR